MKFDQEYIGYWLAIVTLGLLVLPVSSCTQHRTEERTKQVQIMSAHCASQGKTFKAESTDSSDGMCI